MAVTDQNREAYRNTFSAIFSDFHLFETLRGVPSAGLAGNVDEYLRLFSLEKKLQIVDGRFSTTSLSTGQRKRLAMLVALLEDRPFYLFDELGRRSGSGVPRDLLPQAAPGAGGARQGRGGHHPR